MTAKPTSPPPAYFLSLSLENVRSFGEKQTISFARPDGRPAQWTIILGDNGVGKTTVLKALAGLRPSQANYDSHGKTYYLGWLFSPEEAIKIPGRYNTEGGAMRANVQYGARLLSEKDVSIRVREVLNSFGTDKRRKKGFGPGGTSAFPQEDLGLVCYGYGAGRTIGNSVLGKSPQNIDTCIGLFDDRADLLNPEEWFLQMEYSSLKGDEQAGTSLERVKQTLLQVLPDVTDIQIKSANSRNQQLEMETPYGWVRLRDMSLGYQTLVVWLTDFASKLFIRYPDSPNPLEEPAIVLIDEIDLHLHPSWQRKLIGFLSGIFKNTQFIATAHSPLVVQAAGDAEANIVLLKRDGDQTKVYENPIDVRNWRVDQILTSTFFNLETARSVETEKKMARQATLLNKVRLSAKERHELDALTIELEGESMGSVDGEEDEEAMLRELTRRVGKRPKA